MGNPAPMAMIGDSHAGTGEGRISSKSTDRVEGKEKIEVIAPVLSANSSLAPTPQKSKGIVSATATPRSAKINNKTLDESYFHDVPINSTSDGQAAEVLSPSVKASQQMRLKTQL